MSMSVHGAQAQNLRLDQTIESEVVAYVFMYYQFTYFTCFNLLNAYLQVIYSCINSLIFCICYLFI